MESNCLLLGLFLMHSIPVAAGFFQRNMNGFHRFYPFFAEVKGGRGAVWFSILISHLLKDYFSQSGNLLSSHWMLALKTWWLVTAQ